MSEAARESRRHVDELLAILADVAAVRLRDPIIALRGAAGRARACSRT